MVVDQGLGTCHRRGHVLDLGDVRIHPRLVGVILHDASVNDAFAAIPLGVLRVLNHFSDIFFLHLRQMALNPLMLALLDMGRSYLILDHWKDGLVAVDLEMLVWLTAIEGMVDTVVRARVLADMDESHINVVCICDD